MWSHMNLIEGPCEPSLDYLPFFGQHQQVYITPSVKTECDLAHTTKGSDSEYPSSLLRSLSIHPDACHPIRCLRCRGAHIIYFSDVIQESIWILPQTTPTSQYEYTKKLTIFYFP